jgi:phospholipase C
LTVDLGRIETLVVVMLENRSFDHLLGYLSLGPWNRSDVEGLKSDPDWQRSVANLYGGKPYAPFRYSELALPSDPPHERQNIALQLGPSPTGRYPLNGFVESYASVQKGIDPDHPPAVMGYYTPAEVPITHFFASNYSLCDHWFAPLPASTQPNRLMAMAGFTRIDGNQSFVGFPDQKLVYDWLNDKGIRWRVYHDGIPFFMLMKRWIPEILTSGLDGDSPFRPLHRLVVDVQEEDPATFPQVIFVEPKYTDAPPAGHGRDDHPPTSIVGGQAFQWEVYLALSSKPERWAKTAMIVTYDEHGGFFDHVQPLPQVTNPPPGSGYTPFVSTGLRVPSMIVSPLVPAGGVFSSPFDHTSILKFIGDKFNGGRYSPEVDGRDGVGSLSEVFSQALARTDIPIPPPPTGAPQAPSVQVAAFEAAAKEAYAQDSDASAASVPDTWHV